MAIKLSECLFNSDNKTFRDIEKKANSVLMTYPILRLIGSNLKPFIKNYAKQYSVHLKILYLPFNDSQVWGLFYQRSGIYFIVINSEISVNKQNVALAHEFYHFIVALEEGNATAMDILQDKKSSSVTTFEDQKANAFSSCLLMPSDLINLVIPKGATSIPDALVYTKILMDMFIVPYKTAVIRLLETGKLSFEDADKFIRAVGTKVRNDLEKNNLVQKIRWEHPIKNYVDTDDLEVLIDENENYDFISSSKASKYKKQAEEIVQKILGRVDG